MLSQRRTQRLHCACEPQFPGAVHGNSGDVEAALVLPAQELQEVESGLLRRRVISRRKRGVRGVVVELPVFRDWLLEKGEAELLPVWRTFQDEEAAQPAAEEPESLVIVESSAFPIEEDELLSVSEKLVYLGKQKDVAEVRQWLRQFDDDARIEVAFMLLKRLVE